MAATPRRWLIAFGLWVGFGLGIHAAAPTLNGVKLGGLPLGYWLAAQGAPLLLLVLALRAPLARSPEPARPGPATIDEVRS
jgi:putative solute:sodium symporter small subunit